MNNERYAKAMQYKAALDSEWKNRDPVSLYGTNYEKTLGEAKMAGFKVLRNSKGEHRLVDDTKNEKTAKFMEFFAEAVRNNQR